MSFEDEKLHAALEALRDTERRCEIQTGFAKGLKKKKKYVRFGDKFVMIGRKPMSGY